MANPEEAAKLMIEQVKALAPEAVVAELRIVRELAVTSDVEAKGFGTINPQRFANGVEFLFKNVDVGGNKPEVAALFSTDYLPATPGQTITAINARRSVRRRLAFLQPQRWPGLCQPCDQADPHQPAGRHGRDLWRAW